MTGNEISLLHDRARDYGITLTREQLNLFRIYLDELWEWNRRFNLIGVSTRERVVTELFLDTLVPANHLPQKGKMLDVGSGAGLPGLPLKIYKPQLKVDLLEVKSKKVSFLKHAVRLMKLTDIEIIQTRVEDFERDAQRAGYNLITARAFSGLGQTISQCSHLLVTGGLLISFLGSRAEEDLRENRKTIKKHGLIHQDSIPYCLPGKRTGRCVLIFKKKT